MYVRPELELDPRLMKSPTHSQSDIMEALHQVNAHRENLEAIYNQVTDPAVLDSIIHQMVVAEQNYDKLLRKAREADLSNAQIPVR